MVTANRGRALTNETHDLENELTESAFAALIFTSGEKPYEIRAGLLSERGLGWPNFATV